MPQNINNKNILLITIVTILIILFLGGLISLQRKYIGNDSLSEGITSAISLVDIAPKGFVYQPPEDISPEAARKALETAEDDLAKMNALNVVAIYAADALLEAKMAYNAGDYNLVFQLTQLISYTKKEKIEILDKIKLLEIRRQLLQQQGITGVGTADRLIQQAMNAQSAELFAEAKEYLRQATEELNRLSRAEARRKVLSALGRNFFIRYWWEIVIVLALVTVSLPIIIKRIRGRQLQRKITALQLESEKTKDALRKLQKECFVEKRISVRKYNDQAARHEGRIAEIKRILPLLKAQQMQSKSVKKTKKVKEIIEKRK